MGQKIDIQNINTENQQLVLSVFRFVNILILCFLGIFSIWVGSRPKPSV